MDAVERSAAMNELALNTAMANECDEERTCKQLMGHVEQSLGRDLSPEEVTICLAFFFGGWACGRQVG